ncbi:MAG: hypothetical protein ACI9DC_001379 [Gammaproteobacteria bacterium]|jgi:hypothetical protein
MIIVAAFLQQGSPKSDRRLVHVAPIAQAGT